MSILWERFLHCTGQDVREHDKDNHIKNGKFICNECPFESDDKKSVVHHFVAEHKRIPFFNCVKCNDMFFMPKELRNHMKEQHEMYLDKKECPICFVKLSKNKKMVSHMAHGARTAKQFWRGVQWQAIQQIDRQASWVQDICDSKSHTSGFWTFWTSKFTNFKTRLWTRDRCHVYSEGTCG